MTKTPIYQDVELGSDVPTLLMDAAKEIGGGIVAEKLAHLSRRFDKCFVPITRADTALCAWEAYCDHEDVQERFELFRDQYGTATLRELFLGQIAPLLDKAWDATAEEDRLEPFDWEFVPWFLRECIECDRDGNIKVLPAIPRA